MGEEAKEELWRISRRVLAETRHEIEAMQEKAKREIEHAHHLRVDEYQKQLGNIVIVQSEHLIRQAGGGLFQRTCTERFLEQLSTLSTGEYHVVSLADGQQEVQVRIISANVLDTEHMVQLEQQAQKMVGQPVNALYRVDPALVAGVTMYVGDRIIDGSLAGSLRGLYDRYVADVQAADQNTSERDAQVLL